MHGRMSLCNEWTLKYFVPDNCTLIQAKNSLWFDKTLKASREWSPNNYTIHYVPSSRAFPGRFTTFQKLFLGGHYRVLKSLSLVPSFMIPLLHYSATAKLINIHNYRREVSLRTTHEPPFLISALTFWVSQRRLPCIEKRTGYWTDSVHGAKPMESSQIHPQLAFVLHRVSS